MSENMIQTMRERITSSSRKIGLSYDEARETTKYSQELLDQYRSSDDGISGVAAFRLDAYLSEPKNQPIKNQELEEIADALRMRITSGKSHLRASDLQIGLALHSSGSCDHSDIESLTASMKGIDDFSVVSHAAQLIPIIGIDFLDDYLSSTELFETGGMGGPQRPLIREMAEEALRNYTAP